MNNKSRIQKGARFVNHLTGVLKSELDIHTHGTKGSGNGLDKADIAIPALNIRIEAKNAATINLLKDWEQTKAQAFHDQIPVLMLRNPKLAEFKETLVVLELGHFVEITKRGVGTSDVQAKFDYQQTQALDSLKTAIREYERNFKNDTKASTMRLEGAILNVRKLIPTL